MTTPNATVWPSGKVPEIRSGKQSDFRGDQSILEKTKRETARDLVAHLILTFLIDLFLGFNSP